MMSVRKISAPTDASVSSFYQLVIRRTSALVFALRVDAGTVLARLWTVALVYIGAVATGAVQFVALVALAAEHAKDILAMAEDAQIAKHLALVDVDTRLLVALVRMHKTHLALAAISARIIQTVAVLAKRVVLRAFVGVLAVIAVASKAGVARTLRESSVSIERNLSIKSHKKRSSSLPQRSRITLKEPSVLMQWALESQPPLFVEHSLTSQHSIPFPVKPSRHVHTYEP